MGTRISLGDTSRPFLDYLDEWFEGLEPARLDDLISQAGGPRAATIYCVDLLNGFAHKGPLASERVKGIVQPIRSLFELAHDKGIRSFVLPQDCHPPDAPEFAEWPPHCIEGTEEAQTVPELTSLPFSNLFKVVPKLSLSSHIGTELESAPLPKLAICAGDVTDLCVYQLAMAIKLRSNVSKAGCQVVVPANCVQTYDLPVEAARKLGAMPHPGDLFHKLALLHLRLNGVQVVREIV